MSLCFQYDHAALLFSIITCSQKSVDSNRYSRHEAAIDTAWRERSPDQALRVAAGIPRKHASGGLWPGGHYCPRCEAFPECIKPGSLKPGES